MRVQNKYDGDYYLGDHLNYSPRHWPHPALISLLLLTQVVFKGALLYHYHVNQPPHIYTPVSTSSTASNCTGSTNPCKSTTVDTTVTCSDNKDVALIMSIAR